MRLSPSDGHFNYLMVRYDPDGAASPKDAEKAEEYLSKPAPR